MFLIPTYLGRSSIHGYGVFIPEEVPAGTIIWEFVDGVDVRLTEADLEGLPATIAPMIRSYCFREVSGMYVLCGDNAKYMNHSDRPTCDDSGIITTVRRDLPAGTELTCDYRAFDYDTINGRGEWFTSASTRDVERGVRTSAS